MFATLMGLPTISPADLHRQLAAGGVHVFDVNARGSWLEARVPGAAHLDPQSFDAAALPADRDAMLVFYCSNPLCRKAPNAARRAKHMGWSRAHVMSAGIRGWLGAGLPVERGE